MRAYVRLGILLFLPLVVSASTLDVGYGSLSVEQSTTSSAFTDALSVGYVMPYAGSALVLSTYSALGGGGGGRTGSWRLYDAGTSASSETISRYLSGSNDRGIASSMHVFSGLSAGANSLSLQQSVDTGENLSTFGVNMMVIPLVTSGGDHLNYGLNTMTAVQSVSSTTYVDSGLVTSVEVSRSSGNGIYIATSFNTQTPGATAETFSSQLQYRRAGDTTWTDIGLGNRRYLAGDTDTGVITLYGAVNDLDSGLYEVRVAAKTATANAVDVLNGELAAVAMSYTNAMDGGYFELFDTTSAGGENTTSIFSPILGLGVDVDVATNANVVATMSFGGYAAIGANQTASFRLSVTNAAGGVVQSSVENERQFARDYDYGSGGAVGYFTNLVAGTYTIIGEHDELNGATFTENVTLVGFATVSVPEPTTMALISCAGLIALLWRRFRK